MTKAAPRNPWQPAKPRRAQALHRILAFGAPLVPGTALAADGLARMLGITSVAAVALLLLLVLALSLRNRELRATRRALKMALAERDPILSALPDLIWFKDASGVYLSCNTAFAEVVDCNQSAIAGKTDLQLLDPTTARQWRSHHRHAIEAGRAVEVEEWLAVSQSGYTALLLATRRPVYGTDGRLVGVLGVARDVTALRTAEDQSRRQAPDRFRIDSLHRATAFGPLRWLGGARICAWTQVKPPACTVLLLCRPRLGGDRSRGLSGSAFRAAQPVRRCGATQLQKSPILFSSVAVSLKVYSALSLKK